MSKVRWGVLSTAKIGLEKVIPAMQQGEFCDVVAIASRSKEKADEAANQLGIANTYGAYETLLADPDIDAVYIPLPNHLHVRWAIAALKAGKHVLCEKPLGLSSEEAMQLVAAAEQFPHLKVMEAFMYRHHPQWRLAKKWVEENAIGNLKTIQSFFSYYNVDPRDIRNKAALGGGGLMDIGCYPISVARFLFDAEPHRVVGHAEFDPQFQTDRLSSAILDFIDGVSTFTCSTQLAKRQRVNILGDEGGIEIEIPFNAPPDRPCKLWLQTSAGVEEVTVEVCDQYTVQGDLFSRAILDDAPPPTPLSDAVANMRVIEALNRSIAENTWADV